MVFPDRVLLNRGPAETLQSSFCITARKITAFCITKAALVLSAVCAPKKGLACLVALREVRDLPISGDPRGDRARFKKVLGLTSERFPSFSHAPPHSLQAR